MEQKKKTGFSSKVGLILAAAGSAVGLGNIWKFPYVAGENGGGAFLIVYLLCVAAFGLPLLMTEFFIGKKSGKSAYGAFQEVSGSKGWQWLSWWFIISVYTIMGFYFVVTGWCVNYLIEAITNAYAGLDTAGLTAHFGSTISDTPRMIVLSLVPVALTAIVLWFDVNKGIERLSKILMPMLLIMLLMMAGRVLMLDGSDIGMRFLFQIDFSRITPEVVMKAAGQCFFSLSVGLGLLITYGAYMPKTQDVTKSSIQVIVVDTLVAVLAGIIIFPAVFSFGFNPAEGPELVFVVLPAVLQQMSFAWLSGVLFFSLLFIAALTSTIALMEVAVAGMCEASHNRLNRHQSVCIVSAIVALLIVLCVVSMTGACPWLSVFGRNLFDLSDALVTTILMPVGALCMSLFVGWFLPMQDRDLIPYSQKRVKRWLRPLFVFALRWVVPIAILIIFLNGLGVFHLSE